ncbi:hypothetical protein NTE12_005387 [Vibrio harveyi]|uniref:hypothetical protein n=1 Tax=Vibrio harveyi TaxID=669 RepID=UPI00406792C0|nr:hypothetical protein [Vibrio harveyi]
MKLENKPKFPISVTFLVDGEVWVLDNINELGSNLEWFDSSDPEEEALVKDAENRDVVLVVEKLEVKEFKLA